MKKLVLTFCVFFGLTTLAHAQTQEDILAIPITAVCTETNQTDKTLKEKYGEIPFAEGPSVVWNSKIEDYIPVILKIFVNPSNHSFTVFVEVPEDGLTCIISTGEEFKPSTSKKRNEYPL